MFTLALTLCLSINATTAFAQEKSPDDWQYDFEVYFWLPTIQPTTFNGTNLNWSLSDLLRNLDMMAMFNGNARKGKWSLGGDFIYLNLGDTRVINADFVGHPREFVADLDLRALPFTAFAGYQIAESQRNSTDIIGGIRYIYIRIPVKIEGKIIDKSLVPKVITWDGIAGFRGQTEINDQWYFDYYADVGTGQSKITYQGKVGFGYRFNKWTGTFGYRYLHWNYKSDELLDHLSIYGPYIGAKFSW
jgi:hypothetical protein